MSENYGDEAYRREHPFTEMVGKFSEKHPKITIGAFSTMGVAIVGGSIAAMAYDHKYPIKPGEYTLSPGSFEGKQGAIFKSDKGEEYFVEEQDMHDFAAKYDSRVTPELRTFFDNLGNVKVFKKTDQVHAEGKQRKIEHTGPLANEESLKEDPIDEKK